jgi:5'-nucleotidase
VADSRLPTIMITNDDGVKSPGLLASIRVLMELGNLLVVAPASPQSSMGRSFGVGPGQGVISEVTLEVDGRNVQAYSVVGPPALVVAHALTELTARPPTLCVSGINYGENLGRDLQGSGTVGAAFEAEAYGIPAIAVSLAMTESIPQSDSFAEVEWGAAEAVTRQVALRVLSEGLPKEATLLNINVPARPSIPLRWRITRQSAKRYYSAVSPGARDWSQSHELDWRALDGMDEVERDSDIWAVMHDGVVSITPMSWDQTARCEWEFEQHVGGG